MRSDRTALHVDARILTESGVSRVVHVGRYGVDVLDSRDSETFIAWSAIGQLQRINGTVIDDVHAPLQPWWDQLSEAARADALNKLEVVQEILTGYRDGHAVFARSGEPRWEPIDQGKPSLKQRAEAIAKDLEHEAAANRVAQRAATLGIGPKQKTGSSSIRRWVSVFLEQGLIGLVDRRHSKPGPQFSSLDPVWKGLLDAEIGKLDGTVSKPNNDEIIRRAHVALNADPKEGVATPQRATAAYVSACLVAKGKTTRAHASNSSRTVSGYKHYPAVRAGQVVAIDVTRADNLVWDEAHGRSMSVEIISAIDLYSRVVLALRVVPMSADSIDAGLLIYDMLRPFHLHVAGTDIGDWRWAGLPDALEAAAWTVRPPAGKGISVDGLHEMPAIQPTAISADNGSIFLSATNRALLDRLNIDLLVNRKGKPTDNPHVERWHETMQRGIQQLPGYKGRNVGQRGSFAAREPLVTAEQLQTHLRRFVALDYHRSQHSGIIVPGSPGLRMTPIDMFDLSLEATGAVTVPSRADLLYEFLPIRWGVVSHAGVEFKNLVYDSEILDGFRNMPRGTSQIRGNQTPFMWDPHDISRIWFRHPETGQVHEVPWRGADLLTAPMTSETAQAAIQRVRSRGGNLELTSRTGREEVLRQLNELTPSPAMKKEHRRKSSAALMRVNQSRTDHAEAHAAISADEQPTTEPKTQSAELAGPSIWDDKPWPLLVEVGA